MSSRLNRGYIVAAKLFFGHKCDLMGSGVIFLLGVRFTWQDLMAISVSAFRPGVFFIRQNLMPILAK